jgi:hypothetical protein
MTKSQELEPGAADQVIDDWPARTAVSLTLPETLTFDEWREVGRKLGGASTSLRWYVGDWLLHCERKWGETYGPAAQIMGLSYDTLAHCKSIAEKFEPWCRRQKLRWGDHREVAGLSVENQDLLLDAIEAGKWSRERLRHEVGAAHRQERDARIAREESLRTPEERAQIERERDERRAASNAQLGALTSSIAGGAVDLQRIADGIIAAASRAPKPNAPEPKPTIRLDDSGASDSEFLRSLKIYPAPNDDKTPEPPPLDRTQIAMSAISALEFDHALTVVHWWFGTLNGKQRDAVYAKIAPRSGFKAKSRVVIDVEPDNV